MQALAAPQALARPFIAMTVLGIPTIVICDPIHKQGVHRLRQIGRVVELERHYPPDELIEVARDADVLVVRSRTHIPSRVINALPDLKIIARAGAGLDNIDVSTARARGIQVINAPDANTLAVAEHTIGLMIGLARHIPAADASMKQGAWEKKRFLGSLLAGKTLGIIGFGRIGRQVARRAAAFDMRVIVNQPRLTPELALSQGVTPYDFYDLLELADFVSIHVPMRPENIGLMGETELARMKPGAFLINTARGGIVDEDALLDALTSGHLAGAAMDVFANEPKPRLDLVQHPRVIATPHIAASTRESQQNAAITIAEQIAESMDSSRTAGTLNLHMVPTSEVVTHETIDQRRVNRLRQEFERDGILTDPPVVAFWDGRYVVLDGATRTTTLRQMGMKHLIVQLVSPGQDITLHTWSHVVSHLDFDAFLKKAKDVEHLILRQTSEEKARDRLQKGLALAYIHHPQQGVILMESDAPTWLQQLDTIREAVDIYSADGEVERTLNTDLTRLEYDFPDLTMLVVFRSLDVHEILMAAAHGHPMPAGVTRFVIPGRILRLNAPLAIMASNQSVEEKNRWLRNFIADKMSRANVRYYQEPVVLLD